MKKIKMTLMITGMLLLAGQVEAKIIRATDLGANVWSDLSRGKLADVTVEFRQGDEIPVNLTIEGDLMETKQPTALNYVEIKRNFWLRLNNNNFEVSFDGTTFKKFSDYLTGRMEAGGSGSANGIVNSINIIFKAFIK